jgi:hypothetical protein
MAVRDVPEVDATRPTTLHIWRDEEELKPRFGRFCLTGVCRELRRREAECTQYHPSASLLLLAQAPREYQFWHPIQSREYVVHLHPWPGPSSSRPTATRFPRMWYSGVLAPMSPPRANRLDSDGEMSSL